MSGSEGSVWKPAAEMRQGAALTLLYAALAPIPLSTFAGEPSQNVGKSFLKSYAAVCLEGAVIVLACIIFSVFASSPPVVDPDAAAARWCGAILAKLPLICLFWWAASKCPTMWYGNDGL